MSVAGLTIRQLRPDDVSDVSSLAAIASREGFRFLDRFVAELKDNLIRLDTPAEFFLCADTGWRVIAVGGVTPDPYTDDASIGRIRHVYVHPDWRGRGVGRSLLREIETRAHSTYSSLRLRTDFEPAARFYEKNGYRSVQLLDATHIRVGAFG